jgi:hypothetical protein
MILIQSYEEKNSTIKGNFVYELIEGAVTYRDSKVGSRNMHKSKDTDNLVVSGHPRIRQKPKQNFKYRPQIWLDCE